MRARVAIAPPGPASHGVIDTWWVAADGGSLWVVNANYDRVTRVDAAQGKVVASIPVPLAIPFGDRGSERASSGWRAPGRWRGSTRGRTAVTGTVTLSVGSAPIFTQVAAGDSGLWATDYDTGFLYRIHTP